MRMILEQRSVVSGVYYSMAVYKKQGQGIFKSPQQGLASFLIKAGQIQA